MKNIKIKKKLKKHWVTLDRSRQKFAKRVLFTVASFLFLSIIIVFYCIYQPLTSELEKSLLENFQQLAKIRYSAVQNNINQGLEGARSISSRSLIRDALLSYENEEISIEELREITQDRYGDGAQALENLVKSERYVAENLIAGFYSSDYDENKDKKDKIDNNFFKIDYEIDIIEENEYLTISSPIYTEGAKVGFDHLIFDLRDQIEELCTDEIKTRIITRNDLSSYLTDVETLEETKDSALLYQDGVYHKVFHLKNGTSLLVSQDEVFLLEPVFRSARNTLIIGFTILIFYTLGIYLFIVRHAKKELDSSRIDLNSAIDQVNTDLLTGVHSRRKGENMLERSFQRFRKGEQSPAILVLDIDSLKKINDFYGHLAGDLVIKTVAQKLEEMVKKEDIFSRWGGDEFIGIFEGIEKENSINLVEDLSLGVSNLKIKTDLGEIQPNISIGISYFLKEDKSYMEAVNRADIAMYKKKIETKNKIKN